MMYKTARVDDYQRNASETKNDGIDLKSKTL